MTKQEADALKTYIDFMAEQTEARKVYNAKALRGTFVQGGTWNENDFPTHINESDPADPEKYKIEFDKNLIDILGQSNVEGYTYDRGNLKKVNVAEEAAKHGLLRDEPAHVFDAMRSTWTAEDVAAYERAYVEESGEIDPKAFDELKTANYVSMIDLFKLFLKSNKDVNSVMIIEFAKLVRVLTIQETTDGISARMKRPKKNWLQTYPVPYVKHRPDVDNIKLPKDFKI